METDSIPRPLPLILKNAAELPPTGLSLEPDYSFEELIRIYKKQITDSQDSGFIIADGITTLADARAAILAVRESPGVTPLIVTFACDDTGRSPGGDVDMLAALAVAQGMGAHAFGIVCAPGSDSALAAMQKLAPYAKIPLALRLSAGESLYYMPPDKFTAWIKKLAFAGVRVFGTCHGVDETHIAELEYAVSRIDFSRLPVRESDDSVILCATEKDAHFIDATIDVGEEIECSPDILEDILDAEGEPAGAIKIALLSEDDVAVFNENQYMIAQPLCLSSDSPELLESALRVYNGRAFYDGTGYIEAYKLIEFRDKYGLVCL